MWGESETQIYVNEGSTGTVSGITASGNVNTNSTNGNPGNSFANTSSSNTTFTFSGFDLSSFSGLKLVLDAKWASFPSTTNTFPSVTVKAYKNNVEVFSDATTIAVNTKVTTYNEYTINIAVDFDKIVLTSNPSEGKTAKGAASTVYSLYMDNIKILGTPKSSDIKVTGVTLDNDKLNLKIGYNSTLTATVAPLDAANKNISWSSSNESVATVEDGVVTAVSAGNAEITVTTEDGNYTATCDVTVAPFVQAYSNLYTSGTDLLTIQGGTSASNAKVKWNEEEYDAIKAGTNSNAGAIKVTVPANTKTLHLHMAGWNNEGKEVTVSGLAENKKITIIPDGGLTGNSPFTLQNDPEDSDYFTIDTNNGVELTLTFTATNGKRFVLFGVNAEADETTEPTEPTLESISLSGDYSTTFTVDDTFNHDGVVVTAHYSNESTEVVTDDATFSTPDMGTSGNKEVTVSYEGKSTTYTITVNEKQVTPDPEEPVGGVEYVLVETEDNLTDGVYVVAINDNGTYKAMTSSLNDGYLDAVTVSVSNKTISDLNGAAEWTVRVGEYSNNTAISLKNGTSYLSNNNGTLVKSEIEENFAYIIDGGYLYALDWEHWFGYADGFMLTSNWDNMPAILLFKKTTREAHVLELNDTDTSIADIDDTFDRVAVNRTLKAGVWNTFCVPFDMEIPAGWEVKKLASEFVVSENGYNMKFVATESIESHTPYMVRVASQVDQIVVEDTYVFVSDEMDASAESYGMDDDTFYTLTFHGNFVKMDAPVDSYFIQNNVFYTVANEGDVHLKGFRGYITIESDSDAAESNTRALTFSFNDIITGGVEGVSVEGLDEDSVIYNLQGQRVNRAEKGVYVVNGRKVIR